MPTGAIRGASQSPLGEAIYSILVQRVGFTDPLITYVELVEGLPPLAPPDDDIANDYPRLFRVLGEVGRACRRHGLPTLTSLVIRAKERSPGPGYYREFHPETGDDPVRQAAAWEKELERVKGAKYPTSLDEKPQSTRRGTTEDHPKPQILGMLRFADEAGKPSTLFRGQITCSHCSRSLNIHVDRNPKAVSAKQPAFVIKETATASSDKPLGHLFIGTILSSPVLYYGSIDHCGYEQRIKVFFNRAIRDRSDDHLIVMPASPEQSQGTASDNEPFSLS